MSSTYGGAANGTMTVGRNRDRDGGHDPAGHVARASAREAFGGRS